MLRQIKMAISKYPEIFYGKFYDYKAVKKGNYYEVLRRTLEEDDWKLYVRVAVVDGMMFSNYEGIDTR